MKKRYTAEQIVGMLREADAKVTGGHTVEQVCRDLEISEVTLYIAPGSPREHAYVESLNSRSGDELLNGKSFACLQEVQVLADAYRRRYNHHQPHSSLGC
jgi:putative transposase